MDSQGTSPSNDDNNAALVQPPVKEQIRSPCCCRNLRTWSIVAGAVELAFGLLTIYVTYFQRDFPQFGGILYGIFAIFWLTFIIMLIGGACMIIGVIKHNKGLLHAHTILCVVLSAILVVNIILWTLIIALPDDFSYAYRQAAGVYGYNSKYVDPTKPTYDGTLKLIFFSEILWSLMEIGLWLWFAACSRAICAQDGSTFGSNKEQLLQPVQVKKQQYESIND